MDLVRDPTRFKSELRRRGEEVFDPREGVVVVVAFVRVDLGLGPAEDPEGVVGSEVDQGKRNGARPGLPCRAGGEELVPEEVVVA